MEFKEFKFDTSKYIVLPKLQSDVRCCANCKGLHAPNTKCEEITHA